MTYKKQLKLISVFSLILLAYIGCSGYVIEFVHGNCMEVHRSMFRCVDIIFFEEYQAQAMILVSVLLSLIPLFFLKEYVYKICRKFALIAIPAMAVLILLAPAHAQGDYISLGFDREIASMLFSVLFVLASWGIATIKTLKNNCV